jgi:hypothetical protein
LSWAFAGFASRAVSSITGWVGSCTEGILECVEVVLGGNVAVCDFNKTVVGSFLRVLVNETTRVDTSHVAAVKRSNFFEFTGVGVATILGKAVDELVWFMESEIRTTYKIGRP